ncbi:type VI secretion system-associated lipoprotein [Chromobacterium haemolyticum]|uniref:type VI secretion system lipoprotein TssJ n=1 Tax=Chromobacterium haemolyticum TaxID=394935 RepID=UPI0009DB34F8|nr:type VI secretion system lipoprotein TssJ [Chromobacterium haemolyticum]OQS33944.1 type VI secretion system-associated lipoprotein [Chromobacterium haemolyticum]
MFRYLVAPHLVLLLTGCSAMQTLSEAASNAYRTVFPKKQDVFNVGIVTDNTANADSAGKALSVVVRIYQLRKRDVFDNALYQTLLDQDQAVLAYDALSADSFTVVPSTGMHTSMPLSQETQYLGVAAFFRERDGDNWRVVVDRKTLLSKPSLRLGISEYRIRLQAEASR